MNELWQILFKNKIMSDISVSIHNVSKRYKIGLKKSFSLKESITDGVKNLFTKTQTDTFMALDDVSFDIKKGDVIGLIGKNGAGKSTLLKVLSRITHPTTGKIVLYGKVASLLEVGTGFHPELTGRENIFLNGTILGMSRKEVRSKFDEIVAFSGIEKFIDTPVKRYSSGMYVRLAFSVAAHLEPDILLVDEVLAVGDAEFQKKCLNKMDGVAKSGRTVIFVSHNMGAVQKLCNKGVLLKDGKVFSIGNMNQVLKDYTNTIISDENNDLNLVNRSYDWGKRIRIISAKIFNSKNEETDKILFNEEFYIECVFKSFENNLDRISVISSIETSAGFPICGNISTEDNILYNCKKDDLYTIRIKYSHLKFTPGSYFVKLGLKQENVILDLILQAKVFTILDLYLGGTKEYSGLQGVVKSAVIWQK